MALKRPEITQYRRCAGVMLLNAQGLVWIGRRHDKPNDEGKGQWWRENHEVHSASVTGPWPHGDRFIVGFQYDITNKPSKTRMQMNETALFTIKNGKIVREEFFYPT